MPEYKTFSELQKGTWSNAVSYTIGDFVNYQGSQYTCIVNNSNTLPTDTDYWVLVAEKGEQGDQGPTGSQGIQGDQGVPGLTFIGAWSNSTSYSVRDWVTHNGSSYYCIQAHTNQEPPSVSYWTILASKGTDGLGSGDVTGPSSATNNGITLFDSTTGKIIKDSGKTIVTTLGSDDTTIPTSKAVKDNIPVKATGAETNTGTDDAKYVTPKALADSDYAKTSDIEVTPTSTTTFSNKRNQKRVYSTTSVATLTPEIDTYDIFRLTAQGEALTIANKSTSTPANGEMMLFEITDNGTGRAISFGTDYVAYAGVDLPTTTTANKLLTILFIWVNDLSKWNLLDVKEQDKTVSVSSKSVIFGNSLGSSLAGGETKYIGIGFGSNFFDCGAFIAPCPGTIKNLTVYLSAAPGSGKNIVFTVMKSSNAQIVTTTISGTESNQGSDLTHSFTVIQGDFISIRGVSNAGSASVVIRSWSLEFDPD